MDPKLKIETLAFVLLVVAFPVISTGTAHGSGALWWTGFGIFVAGGILPVWTRYMDHSTDEPTEMGMAFDERTS